MTPTPTSPTTCSRRSAATVLVLGVDPGLARTGVAVVSGRPGDSRLVEADCVETRRRTAPTRAGCSPCSTPWTPWCGATARGGRGREAVLREQPAQRHAGQRGARCRHSARSPGTGWRWPSTRHCRSRRRSPAGARRRSHRSGRMVAALLGGWASTVPTTCRRLRGRGLPPPPRGAAAAPAGAVRALSEAASGRPPAGCAGDDRRSGARRWSGPGRATRRWAGA